MRATPNAPARRSTSTARKWRRASRWDATARRKNAGRWRRSCCPTGRRTSRAPRSKSTGDSSSLKSEGSRLNTRLKAMSIARKILLAMSTNAWLRERATKTAFVRRSVSTFMPGERLEDAMGAAQTQQGQGIGTILTKLGENVMSRDEAEAVAQHYLEALDRDRAT